ncbi:tyrosine-type recombinase/integrase [Mongoliibacter ruber]|uniref:Site-specific recombinase XerD n=1 Tax=Mongoliibacter ruber TaxID=1750599 RepID=A0A2T0WVY2_9BACT|nr:site-specific integrase [Mongoliibacter ruber]PRY90850.1 site-specific recombinase XerD [Mongoliibacter ruber]
MAIKVTLRQKKISKGRQSLYLDFYPAIPHPETGDPTRREFLGLYVFEKPKTPIDKQHNTDTLKIGESIRQKRENFLNKPEIYSEYEKEQLRKKELGEHCFVEYFRKLANKRKASNHDNWVSALNYIEAFTKGTLKFADLNESFFEDFKEYLLTTKDNKRKTTISQNSAVSYFNKVKAALKQAYKDGILQSDLNAKIECIEPQEIIKQTLTIEELNTLAKAECKYPLLKKYVLFSALTGMPFKEMQNLNWGQVEVSETFGVRIKMIRQKTGKPYRINISEQAYSILGERKEPTDKVFEGLNNRDRYHFFPLWLAETGIKKDMTFHDLRHTYGCLQIDAGTDIYTLQGNMGHSTPRQSMMYGKISDQRKREAADKIKLDM